MNKSNEIQVTIEYLKDEIKRLDPNLKEDDEGYLHALLLLSSLQVGTSIKKLAEFTHLDIGFVKKAVRLLRKSGVFVGRKISASEWFEEKTGGIAFWLDVGVAGGLIVRSAK